MLLEPERATNEEAWGWEGEGGLEGRGPVAHISMTVIATRKKRPVACWGDSAAASRLLGNEVRADAPEGNICL